MKHTPLVKAVKRGDTSEVRHLLASGANPNEGSSDWYTPLYVASARGHTPILALLLAAGATPDARAVQIAAFGNHAKAVRLLLASGAGTDVSGTIPLLNALKFSGFTREQQHRVCELLRAAGARELPEWFLRWRWAIRYGWRWRLRHIMRRSPLV